MILALGSVLIGGAGKAIASQATDTAINFVSDVEGPTPFIHQLHFTVNPVANLKSVQFTIQPRSGSVTRAVSATFSAAYLTSRSFLDAGGNLTVPVFGLYDNFANSVTLSYTFADNSTAQGSRAITTTKFNDPCNYQANRSVVQNRTNSTALSYDFMLLKSSCSTYSPTIMDTDGYLRWVGTSGWQSVTTAFFDNAIYIGNTSLNAQVLRMELDGAVSLVTDLGDIGIQDLHHNIDPGKYGLLLEADTPTRSECVVLEVDKDGNLLHYWDMAKIVSDTMAAAGDDPSAFVRPSEDWFHSNAVTYRASDDTLLVSSRENFVIALDYESGAIKWILGDPSKAWYQYPSLRAFALTVPAGSLAPIGEHSVSITYNDKLLLFDNGLGSFHQTPAGIGRDFALPRKYTLDLANKTATEIFNYDQSIVSEICSSVYEDAPDNYLVDYAVAGGYASGNAFAEIVGLLPGKQKVFDYKYPTMSCNGAFNAFPLHLENLHFEVELPTFPGRLRNISARGLIGSSEDVLIGGFIMTGTGSKRIIARGLGPSLSQHGLTEVIADPTLNLFHGSQLLAGNDDYVSTAELTAFGLTPTKSKESVIAATLDPGGYSIILGNKENSPGIGLLEVYEITTGSSQLVNVSTRGQVTGGDNVLIAGVITGNPPMKVVVRATGPTLAARGVAQPLADPVLTLYDRDGMIVTSNRNWKDSQEVELTRAGLAPKDDREAALLTILNAGAYSAIVSDDSGGAGQGGIALLEVFNIGSN